MLSCPIIHILPTQMLIDILPNQTLFIPYPHKVDCYLTQPDIIHILPTQMMIAIRLNQTWIDILPN